MVGKNVSSFLVKVVEKVSMVYVKYLKDTGDIVEWGERVIL